jgi:transcriptional regulator with XRE-family HTH domain
LPKIDPDILKDFGKAVKRARTLQGWDQKTLGGKIEPEVGASFISKVEKGRKDALDARTVGRFRIALNLDEAWIDKFIDAEEVADSLETKAEREADLVIERLRREGMTGGTTDDLLIQLANNFTEGDHKDRDTAYLSVKAALETLKASERIAHLAGNADAQFAALMNEVDALNNRGEFDLAQDALARQAVLLREEKSRLARLSELQLEKELSQDRLRNRPDLAADRIVRNLLDFPSGKLFWAVDNTADHWNSNGDRAGDVFALQVALNLAKGNYERVKHKKALAGTALYNLGWCHLRLAHRSRGDQHLSLALRAFKTTLQHTSKVKDPENWSARQDGLGAALQELGTRQKDHALLAQSVAARRAALTVDQQTKSTNLKYAWNNLGSALQKLGEFTKDAETLREAEGVLATAYSLKDKETDLLNWEVTQNNLALAKRWLGAVTGDVSKLQEARVGYAACEKLDLERQAPFQWAGLQWNIADLALARYRLFPDLALLFEASDYVARARAFFVEGSEYQTERCDELLAEINEAQFNS